MSVATAARARISLTWSRAIWPVALAVGLAGAAAGAQPASLVARACGLALALGSLIVLTGWSGQLNLHVAAIGLGWGAYAAAGLAGNHAPPLAAILLAPLAVAPAALIVGAVAVRFRGLELAIATLAAGLAFEQMVFQTLGKWLGHRASGSAFESSLISIARPHGFEGDRAYAVLALVVTAVWFGIAALAGRGNAGRVLRVIRDREVVAEARGVPVYAWRVGAFVLSIAMAGIGGAILAGQTGAVTPDSFGFPFSLALLAVATVCGIRRLERALLGAAILILVQEAGAVRVLAWMTGDRADLVFGVGLIVALAVRTRARRAPVASAARPAVVGAASFAKVMPIARTARAPTVLRVDDVRVSFGAARVLDGVSLRVGEGEICGLIGGNGAGKTTLFNCITGLVIPAGGTVYFRSEDITQMPPHRRAHLGLARTFQGVEVFEGLTVEEGLMVAAGLRAEDRTDAALRARAHAALAEVGAPEIGSMPPASLPFATLRLVEIATALVTDPRLVLLDEPLAGLDAAERALVLSAVVRLRDQGRSVLMVEHDRASVEAIADRVYELAAGRATERAGAVATSRVRRRGGRVAARA